ncbi:hypothetical protein AAY473_011593 [Plecturocebus cupreus]
MGTPDVQPGKNPHEIMKRHVLSSLSSRLVSGPSSAEQATLLHWPLVYSVASLLSCQLHHAHPFSLKSLTPYFTDGMKWIGTGPFHFRAVGSVHPETALSSTPCGYAERTDRVLLCCPDWSAMHRLKNHTPDAHGEGALPAYNSAGCMGVDTAPYNPPGDGCWILLGLFEITPEKEDGVGQRANAYRIPGFVSPERNTQATRETSQQ